MKFDDIKTVMIKNYWIQKEKQKDLFKDAEIIYLLPQSTNRNVFYIDCGNLDDSKAKKLIDLVKKEFERKKLQNDKT